MLELTIARLLRGEIPPEDFRLELGQISKMVPKGDFVLPTDIIAVANVFFGSINTDPIPNETKSTNLSHQISLRQSSYAVAPDKCGSTLRLIYLVLALRDYFSNNPQEAYTIDPAFEELIGNLEKKWE